MFITKRRLNVELKNGRPAHCTRTKLNPVNGEHMETLVLFWGKCGGVLWVMDVPPQI